MKMLLEGRSIGSICRTFDTSRDTFKKFRRSHAEVEEAFAFGKACRKTGA